MVSRHDIDKYDFKFIQEGFASELNVLGKVLTKELDSYFLESLYGIYLALASFEYFLTHDESKTLDYLNKSLQCCEALYNLAQNVGKPVVVKIDEYEQVILNGEVNHNFFTPWNYSAHILLNILLRKNQSIRQMLEVGEDLFAPEKAGLSAPNYYMRFFKVLKAFLQHSQSTKQLLEEIDGCFNEIVEYYEDQGKSYEDDNTVFRLRFFKAILNQDPEALKGLVEKALTQHREYYGQGGKQSNSVGLYNFYIAGLIAFAHDIGQMIEVESDYLPAFLVKGTFTKERITWPME